MAGAGWQHYVAAMRLVSQRCNWKRQHQKRSKENHAGAFGARGVENADLYMCLIVLKYLEVISDIFGHGIGGIIILYSDWCDSFGSNWVRWL